MGSSAGKERVSAGEFTTVDMGMETMPMIKPPANEPKAMCTSK